MSMHKIPLTQHEEAGLRAHGLRVGRPSQLSDCFRQGMAWQAREATPTPPSAAAPDQTTLARRLREHAAIHEAEMLADDEQVQWAADLRLAADLLASQGQAVGAVPLTDAARDVLAERHRQVEAEGWTPEHDDEHDAGEMALAAACYAAGDNDCRSEPPSIWPWDSAWWKPSDRRRMLVKAGALILAEIERRDRATGIAGAKPA